MRYAIGAAGLVAFLSVHGLPRWVVVWAVVAWVVAPPFVALQAAPSLAAVSWVAWWLWGLERLLQRPCIREGALVATATALLFNASPPALWTCWAGLGVLYALGRAVRLRHAWTRRKADTLRAMGVAAGMASMMTAGRLLAWWCEPHVEPSLGVTSRASLLELWGASPHPGSGGLYLGLVAVLGGVLALFRHRPEPLAFTLVAGAAWWMSPRVPGALELGSMAMLWVAAWGLAELEWTRGADARTVPVTVAVAAVTAGVMLWAEPGAARWMLTATSIIVLVAAFATPGWRVVALWWVPIAGGVDAFAALHEHKRSQRPVPSIERLERWAKVMHHQDVFRIADFGWSGARAASLVGMRDLLGPSPGPLDPRYRQLVEAAPHSAALLRAMNVAIVGYSRAGGAISFGTDPVRTIPGLHWVQKPWPLAFWTAEVSVVENYNDALLALMDGREHRRVVFEREFAPPGISAPKSALRSGESVDERSVVLLEQRHNRLRFEVSATGAGFLVVAERFADHWTAEVDGEPVPIYRGNAIGRVLELPPGTHQVEMRYRPPGYRGLWFVWLFTMVALSGSAVVVAWRGAARKPSPGSLT